LNGEFKVLAINKWHSALSSTQPFKSADMD
jgi:hypothetical protein